MKSFAQTDASRKSHRTREISCEVTVEARGYDRPAVRLDRWCSALPQLEAAPGQDEVKVRRTWLSTPLGRTLLILVRGVTSRCEFLIVIGFGDSRLHQPPFNTSSIFILVVIEIKYNIDLEAASGEKHHQLPHPAVYIVDKEGVIRFAHVNKDYKVRLKPEEVLAAAIEAKNPTPKTTP